MSECGLSKQIKMYDFLDNTPINSHVFLYLVMASLKYTIQLSAREFLSCL